ncbi:MAG: Wzz/FepE/Etk N-terminal domain-containing protein, partial [Candidatus Saccharibacteria bacterium]|nr:Wzz/FepE/Etk N-terminal domain-containing protein [Candidatus Saccharibacteria bacterium]
SFMEEINLYDLLRFFAKRWLTIAASLLVGTALGVAYTFYIQQPQYKSTATVLLIGANNTGGNQGSVTINNYVNLFTSRRVLDPVIGKLGYSGSYEQLAKSTSVENTKNTDIIKLSLKTGNAKDSKALLESAIQEFDYQAKALYGSTSVKINVVDSATLPSSPDNIKPVQQIGVATAAAGVLAIIVLFFVYDYRKSVGVARQKGVQIEPLHTSKDLKGADDSKKSKAKATKKQSKKPQGDQ